MLVVNKYILTEEVKRMNSKFYLLSKIGINIFITEIKIDIIRQSYKELEIKY